MDKQPLISVIVPVYKVEKYLKRCVESIQAQTYKNLEIILVDDGSPDRCGEMCDELAKSDERIRVVHKQNGGLSSARNAGLDIMSGEYVGFVDSDDWIATDMYENLYNLLVTNNAQIACCGIERTTSEKHLSYFNPNIQEFFVVEKQEALKRLTFNSHITNSVCDKLFHKSIFSDLRMTEGIIYEDHDIMHRCLFCSERVLYTGKPYYKYFVNEESITGGQISKNHMAFLPVGRKRLDFYSENSAENLPFAMAQYIEWGLDLVYKSRKVKELSAERKELIAELKDMLKNNVQLPLSKNTKLKALVFKAGIPFYVFFLNIFYLVTKGL